MALILVGCAGSGKTALTLTRLRALRGEVLYVTRWAFLARRLWRRERTGHYVPSATTRIRTVDDRGVEAFQPLAELLRVRMLDGLSARGREGG